MGMFKNNDFGVVVLKCLVFKKNGTNLLFTWDIQVSPWLNTSILKNTFQEKSSQSQLIGQNVSSMK